MKVYGYLINVTMFTLIVVGAIQERIELIVAGLLFGIAGLFAMLVAARLEFGDWKWRD